jgi:hypothetical protein
MVHSLSHEEMIVLAASVNQLEFKHLMRMTPLRCLIPRLSPLVRSDMVLSTAVRNVSRLTAADCLLLMEPLRLKAAIAREIHVLTVLYRSASGQEVARLAQNLHLSTWPASLVDRSEAPDGPIVSTLKSNFRPLVYTGLRGQQYTVRYTLSLYCTCDSPNWVDGRIEGVCVWMVADYARQESTCKGLYTQIVL